MSATHRNNPNIDNQSSTPPKATQSIPSKTSCGDGGGGGSDVNSSGDNVVFSCSDVSISVSSSKKVINSNEDNNNIAAASNAPISSSNNSTTTSQPDTSAAAETSTITNPISSSASTPTNSSANTKAISSQNVTPAPNVDGNPGTVAQNTKIDKGPSTRVPNGPSSESRSGTEGHKTPNFENLSKTNLYIRGLATNTTDEVLFNLCSRFGNISSTKAIMDKVTGNCRGYGFVQFRDAHSAESAVQELTKSGVQAQMARISPMYSSHNQHHSHHGHHHHFHHNHYHSNHQNNSDTHQHHSNGGNNHGSGLTSNRNQSNSHIHSQHNSNNHHNSDPDPTNLYIANLPLNMSEQELEHLLSNYGPVVSTRILRDLENRSKGIGFARMETRDKCQEIIDNLNGKSCKGSNEALLVKFADGGIKKRHPHNSHHHHNNHHLHHQQSQHIKMHQDENRWRDSGNTSGDSNNISNFDQRSNIALGNQPLSDLAMMGAMGYHRLPTFPPSMGPGGAYPTALGGPTAGGPQWIHHGAPGQGWNYIPQQMIPTSGLAPPTQAGAGAFQFGHIPSLTSQMQGLQIAHHPGGSMPENYIQHQHQWAPMWPPPMHPHQPNQAHGQTGELSRRVVGDGVGRREEEEEVVEEWKE